MITNDSKKLLEINNLTVITQPRKQLDFTNQNLPELQKNTSKQSNKVILENLNLVINYGEIHVIMGPNGAGKSTLSKVLVKHPDYLITNGTIKYQEKNLAEFTPSDCAKQGIFLSFQNPISIPGVSNLQFLKTSLNAIRKFRGLDPLDAIDFLNLVKQKMEILKISENFLYRSINEDFSGGEKKLNEMLQMLLLEPTLIILDEIDSGLDIDALKIVASAVKSTVNSSTAIIIITHYNRILDYLTPDLVHIIKNHKIVKSGDHTLVKKLEDQGYKWLNNDEKLILD